MSKPPILGNAQKINYYSLVCVFNCLLGMVPIRALLEKTTGEINSRIDHDGGGLLYGRY